MRFAYVALQEPGTKRQWPPLVRNPMFGKSWDAKCMAFVSAFGQVHQACLLAAMLKFGAFFSGGVFYVYMCCAFMVLCFMLYLFISLALSISVCCSVVLYVFACVLSFVLSVIICFYCSFAVLCLVCSFCVLCVCVLCLFYLAFFLDF